MLSAAIDLYKGVDRADPPVHAQLLPGWRRPEPPEGYRHMVALGYLAGADGSRRYVWEIDYLDVTTGVFASEEVELNVTWPWVGGFSPSAADWDAIGIPHLC
ncbi:hypothetical protein [Pseudomonas sp. HS-18]|uniref:hypothetical protein n=1 Tax=Pseudomonas sp. HS-18 TaxID=2879114 RepID=UPI001CF0C6F7|nr:hypothetical protein [Pseudomonas sp. HS-18]UCL90187.1 hypothetical protein LDJ84_30400 [Pseudomonas sp. HS-18]